MNLALPSPIAPVTKELSQPLLTPENTYFPYPQEKNEPRQERRSGPASGTPNALFAHSQTEFEPAHNTEELQEHSESSTSTLWERANGDQDGRPGDSGISPPSQAASAPARPTLAAAKFMTEDPKRVATRPVMSLAQRHSTTARQMAVPDQDSSNSSDGWTSDDGSEILAREHLGSESSHLDTSGLNQVRRHPHRKSKQNQDGRFSIRNEQFRSRGKVARDGRLDIRVSETGHTGYLAKALGATFKRQLHPQAEHEERVEDQQEARLQRPKQQIPTLNIVIMVIGSRGDIQPFLKIGRILQDKYHHRVRIATHPTFKKFVEEDIGLEFFSVGGDPSELMAFMVKNPGLIPTMETLKAGEIGRRRDQMYEMFQGFWRACINATDDEKDIANLKMMGGKYPFVADAIIANPPSFAHYHCAERLGIPLHLVFTFPYSPTQDFPHPLANIKATNVDREHTNYMSYPLVELMTWQGLGDLVNRFRVTTLGLEPLSTLWAPGQLSRLKVPMTYLWSPGLVPKPSDWGPEIDIAGYVFLDLASSFKPPERLKSFLEKSSKKHIIYIGFGSISGIDDPEAFTRMIFEAVQKADVRAVVSKGWGLRDDVAEIPDCICMVDNVPHDWLFPKMDAVVHHGGAGTTAIGLKCGKPTMIVPFFGDQPFWSAMIVRAGAGAKESLPLKKLNADKFAEGITQCLSPEATSRAQELAKGIEAEGDGAENAVRSFHRSLPLEGTTSMRCSIFPDRVGVWELKHGQIKLSALAADLLVENKQIKWSDLNLARNYDWHDFQGPGEPITGAGGALVSSFQEALHGLTSISEHTKADLQKNDRKIRQKMRRRVADAVTLPGQYALHVRDQNGTIEQAQAENERTTGQLNLHGEAEPHMELFKLARLRSHGQGSDIPPMSRTTTSASATEPESKSAVIVKDVAKGVGHTAKALIEMPLDVWIALTLGFRNAPRLYGDRTVRPPPNTIQGFRSGIKAAGDEFFLGLYDGITGLVRIPVADVKDGGFAALPKGISKSVGGLVLKPVSGILGLGAYTAKGVFMGIKKRVRDTDKIRRWIRRARMIQGAKDVRDVTQRAWSTAQPAPGAQRGNELEVLRTRALTQWGSREQELVVEARNKATRPWLVPRRRKQPADRPPGVST